MPIGRGGRGGSSYCGGVRYGGLWWPGGTSEACRHRYCFYAGLVAVAGGHDEASDVEEKTPMLRKMMQGGRSAATRGERVSCHCFF